MKTAWFAWAAAPALFAPLYLAQRPSQGLQDPGQGQKRTLARVAPLAPADGADLQGDSRGFDREDWRDKLTQSDLQQRERDFDALVEMAQRNTAARAALEQWTREKDELAWTSRLALREVDRHARRSPLLRAVPRNPDWNDLRSRIDELEREFGSQDPLSGGGPDDFDDFFGRSTPPGSGPLTPGAPGRQSTSHTFSLQSGPDGVTLEITEDVDGKQETKSYKAENLEALLDAHPELRDKIGTGHGNSFWWGLPGQGNLPRAFTWPDAGGNGPFDRDARPLPSGPPTNILGIEYDKLPAEKVQSLGLEPERGLQVVRTRPGTIASILGIQRGDLIIEMNGVPLYDGEDVGRILRDRKPEAELVVVLIDTKNQHRTLTWKPSEQPSPSDAVPKDKKDKADREQRKF